MGIFIRRNKSESSWKNRVTSSLAAKQYHFHIERVVCVCVIYLDSVLSSPSDARCVVAAFWIWFWTFISTTSSVHVRVCASVFVIIRFDCVCVLSTPVFPSFFVFTLHLSTVRQPHSTIHRLCTCIASVSRVSMFVLAPVSVYLC